MQIAINFVLCLGTVPIVGFTDPAAVDENLGALSFRLGESDFNQLADIALKLPTKATENIFQTR